MRSSSRAARVVASLALLALPALGCVGTGARAPARGGSSRAAPLHQVGKASWYGGKLAGRRTASGERFDEHAMSAAHRTLPFGTLVRVTNRANGRSVVVRINDRGPYGGGLIIDVSRAAAEKLDMVRAGVVPCEVDVVRLGP
ncbi:MAG TPA: septal ring lytic transglycosylase RlpA family protein [Kofleriaceae bacterium]|nr:septal ring lytic transglycosylase RlpA family protein [Kofleriaceae bacterium]